MKSYLASTFFKSKKAPPHRERAFKKNEKVI
jgi:hypothetical protein